MTHHDRLRARTSSIRLELTSKCNLRCVYCALNQPEVVGRDLEVDWEDLTEQILALHPRDVHISGHGESTFLTDWHERACELLDRGLVLILTTNLARPLSEDEVDVISRFARVTVSCDTSDPELYATVRRGGKLSTIEENLASLADYCRARFRQQPYLSINVVLSDLFVAGLPALARWAHRQGVDGLSLVNLVSYPEFPGQRLTLRHPSEVDPAGALAAIEEARRVASELGLGFNTMPGLELSLTEAIAS